MIDKSIGFLGGGNMAGALIGGLVEGGIIDAANLHVSDPLKERLDELSERFAVQATTDNRALVAASQVVVLAVKPQILERVLAETRDHFAPDAVVISLAAGVSTATIESQLDSCARVVRAMPNIAALVRAAATALAGGAHAESDDLELAAEIFAAVGITVVVDEEQLDAVTGLSGSGPAYVFLVLEALADAGVKVGLARRDALLLAAQTVMGAAKLLLDTNEHPGRLKDMVTSPGGTAIAGLHTLEQGGLRTTLINAVESATQRSRQLGGKE
jgi:pyrroline-5-carboxylate reductase